ncbi:BC1881 family protein [bacterium]|nr:MAG: BC1881 family protein [bacterium]
MNLTKVSTKQLVEELRKREGVTSTDIGYNEPILLEDDDINTGPGILIFVYD